MAGSPPKTVVCIIFVVMTVSFRIWQQRHVHTKHTGRAELELGGAGVPPPTATKGCASMAKLRPIRSSVSLDATLTNGWPSLEKSSVNRSVLVGSVISSLRDGHVIKPCVVSGAAPGDADDLHHALSQRREGQSHLLPGISCRCHYCLCVGVVRTCHVVW